MTKPSSWRHLRSEWVVLSYYQRFEGLVALVLTIVIALIILVALFRLTYGVMTGLLLGVLDPLDQRKLPLDLLRLGRLRPTAAGRRLLLTLRPALAHSDRHDHHHNGGKQDPAEQEQAPVALRAHRDRRLEQVL